MRGFDCSFRQRIDECVQFLACWHGAILIRVVPIFDRARQEVLGTIDVESQLRYAFSSEEQARLERCADLVGVLWHYSINAGGN